MSRPPPNAPRSWEKSGPQCAANRPSVGSLRMGILTQTGAGFVPLPREWAFRLLSYHENDLHKVQFSALVALPLGTHRRRLPNATSARLRYIPAQCEGRRHHGGDLAASVPAILEAQRP